MLLQPEAVRQAEAVKEIASVEEVEPDLTGLVEVTKGGMTLHVHPDTVNAHIAARWSLV